MKEKVGLGKEGFRGEKLLRRNPETNLDKGQYRSGISDSASRSILMKLGEIIMLLYKRLEFEGFLKIFEIMGVTPY